jgi:hypothetical protein
MTEGMKVVSLSGSRASKTAPQAAVIRLLQELLTMAESGEIQCFAGAWSNHQGGEFVYQVDAGDTTYTVGQLFQLATELSALESE